MHVSLGWRNKILKCKCTLSWPDLEIQLSVWNCLQQIQVMLWAGRSEMRTMSGAERYIIEAEDHDYSTKYSLCLHLMGDLVT